MGRSISPPRRRRSSKSRDRERERDREKDRDRERDRDRRRRRTRSRERDSRRDDRVDRRERERSTRRDRHVPKRSWSRSRSTSEKRFKETVPVLKHISEAELEGKTPEEQEMMKLMGFCGFDSTKKKKVENNEVGTVHVILKRKYRQYMNRKGGFNRPLDFVA